ncbi:MAG: hypothetical protein IKK50_02045 [Ruminiclostridium sp.]|nr:hypothetical protein [Ruminiclostridium sp.]
MKEWSNRRKVLCTVVVILLLVVYLWPISLGSRIPEDKDLVISWHEMDVIPPEEGEVQSTLNTEVTTYRLEVGSEERSAFQDLLNGYTINRTWRTPFPSDGLNGHSNGGYLLITWTEDEQFVHQVVTGFDRLVMVEDHVYSLGYLDKFLSLDMKERTLAFLGHCTPLDES